MADAEKAIPSGPLAMKLAGKLRRHILKRCDPGMRLPSEAALARQYGRSGTTVRKALAILAAEGLVLRKHGSGTYVGDRLPRATGTTGFLFFSDPTYLLTVEYYRNAYRGVLDAAVDTDRSIHLFLVHERRPAVVADEVARRVDLSLIDSIICLEVFNHNLLAGFGKRMATVSIDFACYQAGVSSCFLDHQRNVDLAVEHLWLLGHRRIALIGSLDPLRSDPAIQARSKAFERSLRHRGLAFDPGWIIPVQTAEAAGNTIRRWRNTGRADRPPAMICVDYQWLTAQAAVAEGVSIPGDLSLVALGDCGPWLSWVQSVHRGEGGHAEQVTFAGWQADLMDPRLAPLRNMQFSAVTLPFLEMGRWATEEVRRRIGRRDIEPRHEAFVGSTRPGNTAGPP